jgi:hypothetical protein
MDHVRRPKSTAMQHLPFYKPILIAIIEQIRIWMRELPPKTTLNSME